MSVLSRKISTKSTVSEHINKILAKCNDIADLMHLNGVIFILHRKIVSYLINDCFLEFIISHHTIPPHASNNTSMPGRKAFPQCPDNHSPYQKAHKSLICQFP